MPAYSPQAGYLKAGDENLFRIDETRVSGQRLAADFSNLVRAFMTSNSGSVAPANHELGTLWFNTNTLQLSVCTRKGTSELTALWAPVSSTANNQVFNITDYRFIFPTESDGSFNLMNGTDISNASGAIHNLTSQGSSFSINASGSGTEHFFIANNTGVAANILILETSGVIAIDAIVGDEGTSKRISMRAGEVWLLRSQARTVGDDTTNWIATVWKYSPPNLQTVLRAEARALYIRFETTAGGVQAGTQLTDLEVARDVNRLELDANGSISVMTDATERDDQRIYFISPFRIERLGNRGFNSIDELSSYTNPSMTTTFTLPDGSEAEFYVYESAPLNMGVTFDYNVVFGET